MRKNEKTDARFDASRPLNLAHEEAVLISPDADYPLKDILLGRTLPFSDYAINLGATQKYYILEHVVAGRGKIMFGGEWYELEAGDTYVIDKNTVRNYYSDPDCPLEKKWVSFASDYVDFMFTRYGISAGVYRIDVGDKFEKILAVPSEPISVKEKVFRISAAVHEIILEIAKTSVCDTDGFSEIKNKLLEVLYEKASLEEIASGFFMSKSNLIRIFKKHTGMTPYQFLLDEKIRVAKVLLKSTSMSVRAIAEELCFTDEHYFSFTFKKRTGISPLKFRNSADS